MREEYAGREVAVDAMNVLVDALKSSVAGRQALQNVDLSAQRISWDEFCDLLDTAADNTDDVRRIGAAGVEAAKNKFGQRSRIARQVLCLEEALSFILYPRNPIDFACIHPAITHEPGRVDVVAYLFERYRASETFFQVLHGAAQAFMQIMDLPSGDVSLHTDGRQAHFVFTYAAGNTLAERLRRLISRGLFRIFSLLLIRSSYAELVYGRKLFENQLIERAKVEERLRRSERGFELRLEQMNDLMIEWGNNARLHYVSPNVAKILGYSPKQVLDDPRNVTHPDDFPHVLSEIKSVLKENASVRVDGFRLLNPQGEARWFEANLSPIEALDGSRRVLGVLRDVTAQRQYLVERQNLDRQLEKAHRLETMGVLAGGIAHDFNNLLMPIQGFAELARTELDNPSKVEERLDHIAGAAHRASELVKQLMTYAGTEPSAFVVVDLVQEVNGLRNLFEASIPANVEVQIDLDDKALVNGDASQLRQVIMNLLINAADSIGQNRGRIDLSVHSENGLVILTVSDNGCGMDETTRERAFEPFYTTKFTGRGLGLSAVLGIVRAHKAELKVDTQEGQGTQIQIKLNAAQDQYIEVVFPHEVTGPAQGKVLLVDDDRGVREVGKAILEEIGYQVELAADGFDALKMLEAHEYDALVLDLVMPRMDGREVMAAARQSHGQLPIVLVSGYSAAQIGEEIATDGYTRFLNKPFRAQELAGALQELSAPAKSGAA